MNPFHDPLNPFPGGIVPGDPMEEVLSLQSYSLADAGVTGCESSVSREVNCVSGASCISDLSSPAVLQP